MGDTRPKVMALTFVMLSTASILLISNEGVVGANAWALLLLSGVMGAATVMTFFHNEEHEQASPEKIVSIEKDNVGDTQFLPEPSDAGFDIPVV